MSALAREADHATGVCLEGCAADGNAMMKGVCVHDDCGDRRICKLTCKSLKVEFVNVNQCSSLGDDTGCPIGKECCTCEEIM
jgi:hypothetical protein